MELSACGKRPRTTYLTDFASQTRLLSKGADATTSALDTAEFASFVNLTDFRPQRGDVQNEGLGADSPGGESSELGRAAQGD